MDEDCMEDAVIVSKALMEEHDEVGGLEDPVLKQRLKEEGIPLELSCLDDFQSFTPVYLHHG
eukprot:4448025-Amphidinium_carterae.1